MTDSKTGTGNKNRKNLDKFDDKKMDELKLNVDV